MDAYLVYRPECKQYLSSSTHWWLHREGTLNEGWKDDDGESCRNLPDAWLHQEGLPMFNCKQQVLMSISPPLQYTHADFMRRQGIDCTFYLNACLAWLHMIFRQLGRLYALQTRL